MLLPNGASSNARHHHNDDCKAYSSEDVLQQYAFTCKLPQLEPKRSRYQLQTGTAQCHCWHRHRLHLLDLQYNLSCFQNICVVSVAHSTIIVAAQNRRCCCCHIRPTCRGGPFCISPIDFVCSNPCKPQFINIAEDILLPSPETPHSAASRRQSCHNCRCKCIMTYLFRT